MKRLTQKRLKELLHYDPVTGLFTRKTNYNNTTTKNNKLDNGYLKYSLDGETYKAHRLAWMYVYGDFPHLHIDHINRNRSDNMIDNLREVTNAENMRNQKLRNTNISGVNGVTWDKGREKWTAYISVDGIKKFLGRFIYIEDAIKARKAADKKYKYHINHGK